MARDKGRKDKDKQNDEGFEDVEEAEMSNLVKQGKDSTLEGFYKDRIVTDSRRYPGKKNTFHIIETTDGIVKQPGSGRLNKKMANVAIGKFVRITYLGKVDDEALERKVHDWRVQKADRPYPSASDNSE